ncbi:MAG: hypothetical protein GX020_00570 [Firmicutes bacterium]|nr:hypothetical protein [Bacillota bacterium]
MAVRRNNDINRLLQIISKLQAENNLLRSKLAKKNNDFSNVENVSLTLDEREALLGRAPTLKRFTFKSS